MAFSSQNSELDLKDVRDQQLLSLIQSGSEKESVKAIAEIYTRYHQDVWLFARSRVGDVETANDIFGQVWEIVIKKIKQYKWRGAPLKSWLLGITINKVRETFRYSHRTLPYEQLTIQSGQFLDFIVDDQLPLDPEVMMMALEQGEPTTIKNQTGKIIQHAIQQLPLAQQKIISAIYYQGMSTRDIGRQLGMKPSTVRVYHQRARNSLEVTITRLLNNPQLLEESQGD